jgi:hypothetical protein
VTLPPSSPPPAARRTFGQRTNRVLFYGMLLGLLVILGGIALNSEFAMIGLPLVLVCASLLFIGPVVTLALPAFRSRITAERVGLRFPALLSGVGLAAIGGYWAHAADGAGRLVGGLLMVGAGAWGVAQAIALPRAVAAGGIVPAIAHSGMILAAALFAALAITSVRSMGGTKERAYLAEMKSDLRNLVTAEEAYFADSTRYTTNLGTSFAASSGVVGPTIALTATGWTAQVGQQSTIYTCAIFVGKTPLAPATVEATPACDNVRPPLARGLLFPLALVLAVAAGVGVSRLTPPAT